MKPKKIAILINLDAGQGRSGHTWKKIQPSIVDVFPVNTEIITYKQPCDFDALLKQLHYNKKVDGFISAGGDGSLNYLINGLLKLVKNDSKRFYVGAIALGSSNDFHKPYTADIKNIPVKINFKKCKLHDIGKITYQDIIGDLKTRHFIINASMGITAEANYRFNHPKSILKFLKRNWVGAAIFIAAVKTIFLYRNYKADLLIDNKIKESIILSNLSVIKNPNISGSFRYEQNISAKDNFLGLNYCDDMSKYELLRTLIALIRGKFKTNAKRKTYKIKDLKVSFSKTRPVEADGEVFVAKYCSFSVIPNAMYIMK